MLLLSSNLETTHILHSSHKDLFLTSTHILLYCWNKRKSLEKYSMYFFSSGKTCAKIKGTRCHVCMCCCILFVFLFQMHSLKKVAASGQIKQHHSFHFIQNLLADFFPSSHFFVLR